MALTDWAGKTVLPLEGFAAVQRLRSVWKAGSTQEAEWVKGSQRALG